MDYQNFWIFFYFCLFFSLNFHFPFDAIKRDIGNETIIINCVFRLFSPFTIIFWFCFCFHFGCERNIQCLHFTVYTLFYSILFAAISSFYTIFFSDSWKTNLNHLFRSASNFFVSAFLQASFFCTLIKLSEIITKSEKNSESKCWSFGVILLFLIFCWFIVFFSRRTVLSLCVCVCRWIFSDFLFVFVWRENFYGSNLTVLFIWVPSHFSDRQITSLCHDTSENAQPTKTLKQTHNLI